MNTAWLTPEQICARLCWRSVKLRFILICHKLPQAHDFVLRNGSIYSFSFLSANVANESILECIQCLIPPLYFSQRTGAHKLIFFWFRRNMIWHAMYSNMINILILFACFICSLIVNAHVIGRSSVTRSLDLFCVQNTCESIIISITQCQIAESKGKTPADKKRL